MFDALNCLAAEHDFRLVALASVICLLGSSTAFALLGLARQAKGARRIAWVAGAGGAGGCGAWSTHFIAILAYRPGFPISFDVLLTTLSLAISIAAMSLGLGASLGSARWRAGGAAIIGVGVGAMHYMGMAALILPGRVEWSAPLVFASLAIGVTLAFLALEFYARHNNEPTPAAAALLLTFAVAGLHFTGMAAARVVPDLARAVSGLIYSRETVAVAVAVASIAILALGLLGARSARRLSRLKANFRAEVDTIKTQAAVESDLLLSRLRDALEAAPQGLALFDAQDRYVLWNARYAELYANDCGDWTGQCFEDALRRNVEGGRFPDAIGREAQWLDERMARHLQGESVSEHLLSDGRWIEISERRTADGGIIAIHNDITALKRREASFQLELADTLKGLGDPLEIMAAASEKLGKALGCHQVVYAEIDDHEECVIIRREWRQGDMATSIGRHRLEDFGAELIEDLGRGKTNIVADTGMKARAQDGVAPATFRRRQIGAFVSVPLVKNGAAGQRALGPPSRSPRVDVDRRPAGRGGGRAHLGGDRARLRRRGGAQFRGALAARPGRGRGGRVGMASGVGKDHLVGRTLAAL